LVDLPDVNVWVALSVLEHPHHDRAVKYWIYEANAEIAFNSQTMMGLVRVLSNAPFTGKPAFSVEEAWQTYRNWRGDRSVIFANEPKRCPILLDHYVQSGAIKPRTWSDAYLAAFAEASKIRLVSFDRDFRSFPGLDWLHLTP